MIVFIVITADLGEVSEHKMAAEQDLMTERPVAAKRNSLFSIHHPADSLEKVGHERPMREKRIPRPVSESYRFSGELARQWIRHKPIVPAGGAIL